MRAAMGDLGVTMDFEFSLFKDRVASIPEWIFQSCFLMVVAVFTLAHKRAVELKNAAWSAVGILFVLYESKERLKS